MEVSERLEGLTGASGNFGPVEKERLGLPQPIVWQLQEPVWQVSWQLQEPVEVQNKVPGAAPAMAKAGVGGYRLIDIKYSKHELG